MFSSHSQAYQALSAQASEFHTGLVQAVNGAGALYASAEAANISPLQTLQQGVLGVINAPTEAVLGRPLIGDGANGTAANPNGGAGGLLYGNGGNGFTRPTAGVARGGGECRAIGQRRCGGWRWGRCEGRRRRRRRVADGQWRCGRVRR